MSRKVRPRNAAGRSFALLLGLAAGCGNAADPAVDGGPDVPDVAPADLPGIMDVVAPTDIAATADAVTPTDVVLDTSPQVGCDATTCGAACVDLTSDPHHCGRCGHDCAALAGVVVASVRCNAGVCDVAAACIAGRAHCTTNPDDGCEADLSAPSHCGACAVSCAEPTPACTMGVPGGGGFACASGCSGATATRCGAACVDPASDVRHCGGCDHACSAVANGLPTCAAGACGVSCDGGFHVCGDACVARGSTATCGDRCTPCPAPAHATATCDGSSCGYVCQAGFADCDGASANGCEADLTTPSTCGACGTRCTDRAPLCQAASGGASCVSGCSAATPTRCGASCVDLTRTPAHCGDCGTSCPAPPGGTATCVSGACGFTCNSGYHACGTSCEDDTAVRTCGSRCSPCAAPANAAPTCDGTSCGFVCNPGYHLCGGACVSNASAATCGASCSPCAVPAGATATCDGTTCGFTCSASTHACDGACVSNASAATCGSSCTPCSAPVNASATCDGTACGFTCNAGYHLCGGACVSRASVSACGASCSPCAPPPNATATCDGTACDFACNAGYHRCGSACVNNASVATCGAACAPCATPANGAAGCDGTACGFTCNSGYHACGSACASNTSTATCGSSCTPCPVPSRATATCSTGACGFTCDAGYHACGSACGSNLDPATCGSSCTPCAVPAYGSATCDGVQCGVRCDGGYVLSGGLCLALPPVPIGPPSTARVTSRRPSLRWTLPTGGTAARVTLCRNRALSVSCQQLDVTGSSVAPTADLAPGPWYWRLQGLTGGVAGDATSATWEFFVGQRGAPVNSALGTVPDFNGDGLADLLVGSTYDAPVGVYMGASSGIASTPTRSLPVPARASYFSSTLASAGDVNGDGFGDAIVGASGPNQVYVYWGSAAGLRDTPDQTLTRSTSDYQFFGGNVSSAGDINADGYGDVIVGGGNGSAIYVFWGSAVGLGATPTVVAGPSWADQFGVSTAGFDANGDGYSDVFVGGAGVYNRNPAVFLYLGGPRGLSAVPSVRSGDSSTRFGESISPAGDVNADGYGDLLVGQYYGDRAWVYLGTPSGIQEYPTTLTVARSYYLGWDVAGGSDLNADGYGDVVVGSDGAAYVFLGGSSGLTTSPAATLSGASGYGRTVSALGDVDGDGYGDFAVGARFAAQVFVYLGAPSGVGPILPTLNGPSDGTYYGAALD